MKVNISSLLKTKESEKYMDNLTFTKESFEIEKARFQNSETIGDIISNPVIKSALDLLTEIPGAGNLARNVLEQGVAEFQKKKKEEFLDYILESGELIVQKDIIDVTFIMELAKTMEVLNRLATNEKIIYIANLFRNSLLQGEERDIDLYEENLKRLDDLSIREITILAKLYQHNGNNEAFYEDVKQSYSMDKDEIKNVLASVTRTGFCKEKVGAYLSYGGDAYHTTVLFEKFLQKIGIETADTKEKE